MHLPVCLQGSVRSVSSGSGDLCCCAAQFVTLHKEPGKNSPRAGRHETRPGVSAASGVWVLVRSLFTPKPMTVHPVIVVFFDSHLLLSFLSFLSKSGKCSASVRAALVRCLVTLLEVTLPESTSTVHKTRICCKKTSEGADFVCSCLFLFVLFRQTHTVTGLF